MISDQEATDYVNRLVTAEVARERERCAVLCEAAGHIAIAAQIRLGNGGRKVTNPERWEQDEPEIY